MEDVGFAVKCGLLLRFINIGESQLDKSSANELLKAHSNADFLLTQRS